MATESPQLQLAGCTNGPHNPQPEKCGSFWLELTRLNAGAQTLWDSLRSRFPQGGIRAICLLRMSRLLGIPQLQLPVLDHVRIVRMSAASERSTRLENIPDAQGAVLLSLPGGNAQAGPPCGHILPLQASRPVLHAARSSGWTAFGVTNCVCSSRTVATTAPCWLRTTVAAAAPIR